MPDLDVLQIVDALPRHDDEHEQTMQIDPHEMARKLGLLIKTMGRNSLKIALVAKEDEQSYAAYAQQHYETHRIDGNRAVEQRMLLIQQTMKRLRESPPKHLVLVTDEPQLVMLSETMLPTANLSVWSNRKTIPELTDSKMYFQRLEDLLPDLKIAQIDVRIDLENIFIGLVKRGWEPNMRQLIAAIKQAIQDKCRGNIVSITGYADFDELNRHHPGPNINWQRELTLADPHCESRYVVSEHGKNSADMKLVGDIRTVLEQDSPATGAIDVFVLATMDRDFAQVIKDVRSRGKKAIVVGLQDGLSNHLRNGEVCYLDEYLKLPQPGKKQGQRAATQPPPPREDAAFMMRVGHWMNRNRWRFVFRDKLEREFASESASLEKLIADGWLSATRNSSFDAQGRARVLEPNPEHTAACAARFLAGWIPDRVDYCLNRTSPAPLPWIDSNYLANGMARDRALTEMGVGQTRPDAEGWLRIAASAGLVAATEIEHPERPGKFITTWRLPEEAARESAAPESAEPTAEPESTTPPVADFVKIRQAGPQLAHLRNLMTSGLDDNDVNSLLLDHFTEVYRRVESTATKVVKIQALLDHVQLKNKRDKLLEAIREKNPSLFEQPVEEAMAA